jgi:hypothetical protein
MRVMAVLAAAAIAVTAVSAADAQTRKKRTLQTRDVPGTVIVHRDETGRTRTKILVQKRSYLDGGTEVMPGAISGASLYYQTPLQRPMGALGHNDITNPLGPIPDPWFLPGKNNPWPWFAY